jgi:hypothetical protein
MSIQSKYDFSHYDTGGLVYIKTVKASDLPLNLQQGVDPGKTLYSLHRPDCERMAIVPDRKLAFMLAREHDLTPLTVH